MQTNSRTAGAPPGSAPLGGYAPTERLAARMAGAAAAMRGEKLGANSNPEESELHFEWLAGWTAAKMEKLKAHNDKLTHREQ
jgi:hypothetical protein